MTQWQVEVNGEVEPDLYDVKVKETANPFGDVGIAYIDDTDGNKFDTYTRGTRVDFFAYDDNAINPLDVDSGETVTISNEIRQNTQLRVNGTLRIGDDNLTVNSAQTYQIPSGDTESYGTTQVEYNGQLQVEGTLQHSQSISQVSPATASRQFSGFVVEAREQDEQGADVLEVECYSFDQFLRRDTVSNDQTGNTIEEALEDIITNDTPVTWNASNVTVVDDQELTRSYRGERVENVLQNLRSTSGGEDFGVNSDLEFYFRPFESQSAPRDIDNTQWFDFDIPEEGKETVNEVTVFFDEGEKSVTIDDGNDKTRLQDNLGTQGPVVLAEEVSRPDITNIEDAKDVAEQILSGRETTLTGTVTTFGLLTAEPGDVINITINTRGIDDNFRIAAVEYRWGTDETILTIVKQKGDQDELLVRISDAVKRLETQDVNRDGISNRITDTNVGVQLPISGDVDGTSFTAAKVTNNLRNQLREAWINDTTVNVADIAVGNGTSAPSRTNTALDNELERASVSQTLPDAQSVLFEASVSETDISEVGLFDASNNLLARATVDGSFSGTQNIDFRIDVEDNTNLNSGVVTLTGQTAVRDYLADNSPLGPTDYAYGSDGTAATESDTSLGNQIVTTALDELLIQDADLQSEWEQIINIADDEPLTIENGELKTLQSAFFQEGENFDNGQDGFDDGTSDTNISNGQYTTISRDEDSTTAPADFMEYNFTVDYTIPASDFEVYVRHASNATGGTDGVPEFDWSLIHDNGNEYRIDRNQNLGAQLNQDFDWVQLPFFSPSVEQNYPDLTPGDYTLRAEVVNTGGAANVYQYYIDCVAPLDSAYSYTFDETVNGNDALDGPELFPDQVVKQFNPATTRREFDSGTATQTWNDTSNNQFIELSNDGGSTFIRTSNSQTASATFADPSTELITQVGISRFGTDSTTSPATGDTAQAIDVHDLKASIAAITPSDIGVADVRAIISPGTITGQPVREAGQLNTNGDLLTHSTFAEFTISANERLISSEAISWQNPN